MKAQLILHEAKRLYDLGFGIHWLKPHSKMPVESGWTTGERKSWEHLKSTFRANYNIGTRLGSASKIGENYLCVIDVDVKGTLPHHKEEAYFALSQLIGESNFLNFPTVASGRGGGSAHFYCVTSEPFQTFNFAESSEIVKVKMPSKTPSKKEREGLTSEELKAGYRTSRAWEISLYSEGRQVVLPPSTHPDTGKEYKWGERIASVDDFPLFDFHSAQKSEERDSKRSVRCSNEETDRGENGSEGAHSYLKTPRPHEVNDNAFSFEVVEGLDLAWVDVSEKVRDLIVDGVWKGEKINRSDFIPVAANALFALGLDRNEVLTILTDPSTELGSCGYEHAKTKSRERAAKWVWKYSVAKVENERSAKHVFGSVPIDDEGGVPLTKEEGEEQAKEFIASPADNGFYERGPKGAKKPLYGALMRVFDAEHPFKSIADMKCVYVFNGTHYVDMAPIEIKGFAETKFNPKPDEKIRNEFLAKVLANNLARREFFTRSTEGCINFKNGILDLNEQDSALLPHSPEFGFRGVLPYEYSPKARCPVFERWIDGVMMGDEALVHILQEFMGYIVRGGEYKYHKALWLEGVGRNGKSTFIDVLKALIGAGNYSALSIKSILTDKFAGADLDGKIANFSEETSPQELSDSGPFKNLTGNGDVFAQKKFGDPFIFRNRAKLVMTYNTIPDLKDLSPGMLSRPLIVPFKKIIADEEMDREIGSKLMEELSGIFNFALDGWKRLERQQGFTRSEKSDLAMRKIKEESCNVYQWVETHVEFMDSNFGDESEVVIAPKDLYSSYMKQERYAFKYIEFCRRLRAHPEMAQRAFRNRKGMPNFRGVLVT